MAKKNSKKAEPEVTQEQLVAVAEDFNTFMVEEGEEEIDTELEYDDLLAEVTEAAGTLVDDDVITQETADTLEALGIEHVAQVEEEGAETDQDPEEDPEEDTDEDEDPDGESIEEMLDRAKANKIPVPPPYRKDKEKLAAYLEKKMPAASAKSTGKRGAKAETKPAEKKGGKPSAKPAAAPKEKKKEKTGLNRGAAVYKAIEVLCKKKGGVTMKNIMTHSDELVVASGGKSNPTATNVNKYTLDALVYFEVLVVNDGKYTFA